MSVTHDLIYAAQSGDRSACDTIVRENSALVWSIVHRFPARGIETEDLFQLGCMGLLKAVYGFDPSLGHQFSTYAVPKIAGEIRRFLRDDGMVKVSRTLKERGYHLSKLREDLIQSLGREPTLSELSVQSGMTVEEIAEIHCATSAPDSLSRETTDDGETLEAMLGDNGIEEHILERVSLLDAIHTLSGREQVVILSRFFKCLTQAQTAARIGISQVQVSRIERAAIKKLRELL